MIESLTAGAARRERASLIALLKWSPFAAETTDLW
jgi:hypothetical protein